MKARPEDDRLPCDHACPPNDNQSGRQEVGLDDLEKLENVPCTVESDAPGGNEEAPEIEASPSFELEEDAEIQLDDAIVCNGKKGRHEHSNGLSGGHADNDCVGLVGHGRRRSHLQGRRPRRGPVTISASSSETSRAVDLAA